MAYLAAAFAVVWTIVFVYVLSLGQRYRALKEEIAILREILEEARR